MIRRLELLMWLAHADPEHVSAYCDLVHDGLLTVESDGDAVTGLSITTEGRSYLPPTLPDAAA
jgi:hypothetical protein